MICAGFPLIMEHLGIFPKTTEPEETITPSQIVVPGAMVTLQTIQTQFPIETGFIIFLLS